MRMSAFMMMLILLTAGWAPAGVIPNRWEKVETLHPGASVIVEIRGGERLKCAFSRLAGEEIILLESTGTERKLPRSAILKMETAAVVRDRLCNGMLIGALFGIAGGLAGMVGFANATTDGSVDWGGEDAAGYLVGAILVGGGIGAATGAIVDSTVKHREVLYQAR